MPTIHYVQGRPFLIPDEVTELPTGTQPALPVTQDWYPAGYDNQQALPANQEPDFWSKVAKVGNKLLGTGVTLKRDSGEVIPGPIAAGAKLLASVVLGNGENRAQLWPERMLRSGVSLADQARRGEVLTGPGLRREDFTDIPPSQEPQTWIGKKLGLPAVPEQPLDPLIERAQDVAGMQMGTTMFAKPGTASVGSGAFRKGNVEVKPYKLKNDELYHGTIQDFAKEIDNNAIEPKIGNFVKKMYGEDANDELVYLADKDRIKSAFTAIKEQIAQKLGKYQNDITAKDIEDYGVLYTVKKHEYDHYRGTEEGLSRNSKNEIVEETPVGVESGDWYSRDTVLPEKKIEGKNLVKLFENNGVKLLSESGKVGAPLSALEKVPMFYSNVENAVKNAKTNSATADQWLGYLKNQPGVKPEELEWTLGQLPQGKITKDQLAQHIAENKVQLGEVWKGNEGEQWQLAYKDGSGTFQRYNTKSEAEEAIRSIGAEDRLEVKPFIDKIPTKYQSYQLPGGENYRELLLTLPQKNRMPSFEEWSKVNGYGDHPGSRNLYEKIKNGEVSDTTGNANQFKSSHWDEPNVLAHVRMNDRNIPDIGKSLHIEEIQSDWHQAGRKSGYKGERNFEELNNKLETSKNNLSNIIDQIRKEKNLPSAQEAIAKKLSHEERVNLVEKRQQAYESDDRYIKALEETNKLESEVGKAASSVPNAPFKKTWDELALKRTINEAVRNGYDAISWTPGEAQAARYDLSKQVKGIRWEPKINSEDSIVRIDPHNGSTINIQVDKSGKVTSSFPSSQAGQFEGRNLSDVVGKEIAEKILGKKEGFLKDLDLKVGGEGMKAFYDKMMVDKANALAKKYGGKVETKEVPVASTPRSLAYFLEWAKEQGDTRPRPTLGEIWKKGTDDPTVKKFMESTKGQPVHVLKLTPELKKAVSEKGFPLFTGGIPHVPPPEEPTFDERWRDRVPDEMTKRDQIKDLLEQQKIRNLPLDYTPPERKFEGRPVYLTKVDFIPEF